MALEGATDAEASNDVGVPAGSGVTLSSATGAWSGVMASPAGFCPTPMGVPAVSVAVVMGTTSFAGLDTTA